MRKLAYLGVALVGLLAAYGGALAQDGAPKRGKKAKAAEPAPALQDAEAIWAEDKAKHAREDAACLGDAARKVEAAAAKLDAASASQRDARADDLTLALAALGGCGKPNKPSVGVASVNVDDPCRSGDPLCDGGLDASQEIDQVLNKRAEAISSCYERALARQPGAAGRLTYEATLTKPPVTVGTLSVADDSVGDAPLRHCIDKAIKTLSFDDGHAGTRFRFVIGLQPTT